jgi:hypothetical protein
MVCFLAMSDADLCCQAQGELSDNITQALEENASAMLPVAVKWTVRRTTPLPAEEVRPKLGYPPGRPEFFDPKICEYIYQKDAAYVSRYETVLRNVDGTSVISPLEREASFDGTVFYEGAGATSTKGLGSTLRIVSEEEWTSVRSGRTFADVQYLVEAGYQSPSTVEEIARGVPIKSLVIHLLNDKFCSLLNSTEAAEGTKFTKVELDCFDFHMSFYLDPGLNYAVAKMEKRFASGELLSRTVNSDFQRLGSAAVWLPQKVSVTHLAPPPPADIREKVSDQPLWVEEYIVDRMDNKRRPKDFFVLKYKPGTWITDHTLEDGPLTYQQPSDPAGLDDAIAIARDRGRIEGRPLNLFLVGNVVAVIALLALLIWRRVQYRQHT